MDNDEKNWYVFYTRPNAEKKAYRELLNMKYDVFLPQVKTLHIWKNRQKKIVYRVLFPGYIFVRTRESKICSITQLSKIVRCVRNREHPGIVPDKVIECIKLMLAMGQEVYAEQDCSYIEHVRVMSGPLTGIEGVLIQREGRDRFGILVKSINQCACTEISDVMLKRIR